MTYPEPKQSLSAVEKVFLAILLLMLTAVITLMPGCKKRYYHHHNGPPGASGQDGQDGVDGQDGTDGLGFDFVRGFDGSQVCGDYWIGNASHIVPASLLALAPPEKNGVILIVGNAEEQRRYFLLQMPAGSYCVVERKGGVALGTISFGLEGFLAITELSNLPLQLEGVVVENQGCSELDPKPQELRIGDVLIRLVGRD